MHIYESEGTKKPVCIDEQDRLINNDDRAWFKNNVSKQLGTRFNLTWDFLFSKTERLMFGDFLIPGMDPRVYEQVQVQPPDHFLAFKYVTNLNIYSSTLNTTRKNDNSIT